MYKAVRVGSFSGYWKVIDAKGITVRGGLSRSAAHELARTANRINAKRLK